ncbi:MAG: hypothetical protein AB8B95_12385 [Pseudohongiellaceae bacterium]
MESSNNEVWSPSSSSSSHELIKGSLYCLSQCDELIKCVSSAHYSFRAGTSSTIGEHMRHILDRYQCLLTGLPKLQVDYDARKRDREIENNAEAACFAIASFSKRVAELELAEFSSRPLKVRETVFHLAESVAVSSTIERELMSLVSHSIHHLAIISMLAQDLGYELESHFGKAPSTIVFEQANC